MATAINAIDKESIHKICSSQVVLDLATAVKELVENSIDAGASSVEIKFKDNGIDSFEVIDNGSGVDPINYESLALKHHTSKLKTFEDLEKVITFGFRGEALSSLSAFSNLVVITATKEQAPMGMKLEFDSNGMLVSQTPIARSVGTTVQLTNFLHSLPVRQREFKRNIKKEFAKALTIIQAYSIISTNIRISVSNQTGKSASRRIMSTTGNKDLISNVSNVLGAPLASDIIPFKIDLESILGQGSLEGYISKPQFGLGRSSKDRQYFFVNGRPCIIPRLEKALNETYRSFIANQYPVLIADLKVPTDRYDVNVTPDKRTLFIHEENKIAEAIMEQLKAELEPSRSTFQVNAVAMLGITPPEPTREDIEMRTIAQNTSPVVESDLGSYVSGLSSLSGRNVGVSSTSRNIGSSLISARNLGSFANASGREYAPKATTTLAGTKRPYTPPVHSTLLKYMLKRPKLTEEEEVETDQLDEDEESQVNGEVNNEECMVTEDVAMTESSSTVSMEVQLDDQEYIEQPTQSSGLWKTLNKSHLISSIFTNKSNDAVPIESTAHTPMEEMTLKNASVKNTADNEMATKALSRVISKPDFARMQVLGQFNLGFMITLLDNQDLYIIDQHASDEKYNFETLQQTTQIEAQKLISRTSPKVLDLTAAEELIVMDNLEIFKANGFEVQVLPENESTKRICVVSQPISKNTMFDKKDFSELVFLITEHPGEMVRCTRTRAMFASRACHKATRIGDYLNKRQMTQIVRHMGEIDQPWNCPHGRPTMRHLLSLAQFKQNQPKAVKRPLSFTGSLSLKK